MAIAPLPSILKSFTFDGESSADYGVQILGEGVFNAPERAVEMVTVPGRNGAIALDQGYWENALVTYPATLIASSPEEFAQAMSDFRNMLCSKRGYCKLTDDYHPDEYRMAMFVNDIEVDEKVLMTGEFDITFNCKPQRWLANGASPVAITDGQSLNNPTQYDASPLLAVDGYGTISFNGYDIEIASGDYGDLAIVESASFDKSGYSFTIPAEYIKNGDMVTISGLAMKCQVSFLKSNNYKFYGDGQTDPPITDSNTGAITGYEQVFHPHYVYGTKDYRISTSVPSLRFTLGTDETWTDVITIEGLKVTEDDGTTLLAEITNTITDTITYDATTQTITFTQSVRATPSEYIGALRAAAFGSSVVPSRIESAVVNSTMTYLGEPTYIDCDLGEAYKIENGTFISLNSYIDLGSDLPTLAAGSNEINFDSTVESLEITPRWWKL